MNDQRNTILAVVLSALALIAWEYFYALPQKQREEEAQRESPRQTPITQVQPTPQATLQATPSAPMGPGASPQVGFGPQPAGAQPHPTIDVQRQHVGTLALRLRLAEGEYYWVYINNHLLATVRPTSWNDSTRAISKSMDFHLIPGDYKLELVRFDRRASNWGTPGFCQERSDVSLMAGEVRAISLDAISLDSPSFLHCTTPDDFEVEEWAISGPVDRRYLDELVRSLDEAIRRYNNDVLIVWARDIMARWPPSNPLRLPTPPTTQVVYPLSNHDVDAFQLRRLLSNLDRTYKRGLGRFSDHVSPDKLDSVPFNLRTSYQALAREIDIVSGKIHSEIESFNSIADWLDRITRESGP